MPAIATRSRCRRCGGILVSEEDEYGRRDYCLQCGAETGELRDPIAEGINLRMDNKNFGARLGERNDNTHRFCTS